MFFPNIPLVTWTSKGLYCAAGDFYIDPHRAVDVAVITHAHSDHARRGHKKYICVDSGVDLLRTRIGKNINVECFRYGEPFHLGKTKVSLHSAGHILGSAQVRIEHKGEVWVASGDYKRDRDPSCDPFESVSCDTFITEATFGTPKFIWPKNLNHGEMIYDWWCDNAKKGMNSILFGYSLGKAQRILVELSSYAHKPVLIHSTIDELTNCYRKQNRSMADTNLLMEKIKELIFDQRLEGELILAPPSILKENWIHHLGNYKTAFASGWMQGNGRRGYDHGFVMSDHADWEDLNLTIKETGARKVYVQHRDGALIRHLKREGLEAYSIEDLHIDNFMPKAGENLILL
ncbi:MAG: ligase-associated DNA damage response exonuclease [Bacteriovoracia bacterium]